ncbi:sensor histidine kinase [Paenibacillus flagellatus]|uniref:histidine kinase n=1 Tax=Paenibacillus flagellatus TaxID=2211139 RepID=A0A2V5K4E1_9BACL|nr:ATP-binding protein [Paenibacillus flagellatus]PYI52533.1 sensor histidine kinase [Paenibacillus flagellatus]
MADRQAEERTDAGSFQGGARKAYRVAVLAVCAWTAAMFIVALPAFYAEMRDRCATQVCEPFYNPPPGTEWLAAHGYGAGTYAIAYTAIYAVFGFVCMGAGVALYRRRTMMGLLGTLMLFTYGAAFTPVMTVLYEWGDWLKSTVRLVEAGSFVAFLLFFAVFPSGTFVSRRMAWLLAVLVLVRVPGYLFPATPVDLAYWSQWLVGGWLLLWAGMLLYVQLYRYRFVSGPLERQQTKWVVYGLSVALTGLLAFTAVFLWWQANGLHTPYRLYAIEVGIHASMLVIPASLLAAVLRKRLWAIDPIVNRTIVYALLSVFVAAVYTAAAWYIGSIFRTDGGWLVSLVATGIVAVLFAPLKERLQRWVNRMLYGERGDPYSVLSRLGKKLEEPLTPEDVLHVVARTIREALRLPYVSVSLYQNGQTVNVARDGDPAAGGERAAIELIHRGQLLGLLEAAPRTPGEGLGAPDRAFLDVLVRQAAAIVQSVKVSLDVKLLAADLQESRERLVLAREEERRELRRNLHDDTAPRLAALALTAAAAEELLEADPAATRAILAELRANIRATVADIRSLAHDLRPPALDELGLLGAVRERVRELSHAASGAGAPGGGAVRFELDAPDGLPPLPAAVEVAAYRIASEAIANVVRHAEAGRCRIGVRFVRTAERTGLELAVADDGRGVRASQAAKPGGSAGTGRGGIGLRSMRERAAELGGTCRIEPAHADGSGTKVIVFLPVSDGKEGEMIDDGSEGTGTIGTAGETAADRRGG